MTPRMDVVAAALKETQEGIRIANMTEKPANVIVLSEEDLNRESSRLKFENCVEAEQFYRRSTSKDKLDAGRTVRSGMAYDFDSTDPVPPKDVERAARIKEELGDEPLMGLEHRPLYRFVKRAFDIAFSAAVIVAFSWLYLIVAVAVKVDDPKGPVFFKQTRLGWSIIGQKSGAASDYILRPALSALEAWCLHHLHLGLGVAA